jgi:hypothetical protein
MKIQAVLVKQATITKQYLVDALIENIEKSLARQPVPVGAEMTPMYVYRGEVANNAIKMAGSEVIKERPERCSGPPEDRATDCRPRPQGDVSGPQ